MKRIAAIQRLGLRAHTLFAVAGLTGALSLATIGCSVTDVVEGNDEKDFPDRLEGPDGPSGPGEPNGCDLTGMWFVHSTNNVVALGLPTVANNFFYLEIKDNGDDFVVTRGWDCGFEICGRLTQLELSNSQIAMLALRNRQDGAVDVTRDINVAPRTGIYKPSEAGECALEMERWWWIRGADVQASLPARENFATSTLTGLRQSHPMQPKQGTVADALNDWDNDGDPGITLNLTLPAGTRAVAHRDWADFGPGTVPDGATDFMIPSDFSADETVFIARPSLLDQVSAPTKDHMVRFVRLSEAAPTDMTQFVSFCRDKVTELIRPSLCNY